MIMNNITSRFDWFITIIVVDGYGCQHGSDVPHEGEEMKICYEREMIGSRLGEWDCKQTEE